MTGARRLPRTLFGGRVRTSTVLLAIAFVGVLLLWYAVRPEPVTEVVRVRTSRISDSEAAERRQQETDRPKATASATPSRTVTPTPTAQPKRTPTATPSPSAPGLLPETPADTASEGPEPDEEDDPRGPGLLDNLSGARAPEGARTTEPDAGAQR